MLLRHQRGGGRGPREVTSSETLVAQARAGLRFAAEVAVSTKAGDTVRARCDAPHGHAHRPADTAALLAKFADCVAFGGMDIPADLGARLIELPEAPTVAGLFAAEPTGARR